MLGRNNGLTWEKDLYTPVLLDNAPLKKIVGMKLKTLEKRPYIVDMQKIRLLVVGNGDSKRLR
jgi:hypothetical protein